MSSQSPVPKGFPAKLEGPLVWDGEAYQSDCKSYVISLSGDDIDSVDKALRHFQGLKLASGYLTTETFPLPAGLSNKLDQISDELYSGRGFVVVRGLDPRKYTPEENVIVFAGVASHVAPERSTDPNGLTLSHIRSAQNDNPGPEKDPVDLRPSKKSGAMAFHTDTAVGDILAMYIKGLHENIGGKQRVASFWQIYNILAKEAPHVLHALADSWPWEDADPITKEPRVDYRPLIFPVDGKVQIQFVTVPLLGTQDHPRPGNLPSLTAAQKDALEIFQSVAERVCLELDRVPGDIQFVNNLSILHARTALLTKQPDTKISAYTNITTKTVSRTVNTIRVDNAEDDMEPYTTLVHTNTGPATNTHTDVEPTSTATAAMTRTSSTNVEKKIVNDGKTTTTTITTVSKLTTVAETTTHTNTSDQATPVLEGPKHSKVKVMVHNRNVDGDPNTTRDIKTSTKTFATTCPYIASELIMASGTPRSKLIGYQSPRHFLRLFLRDKSRSWPKPDVYQERFERCFEVPAEKQFLPAMDFDPYGATVNTGDLPHG